MGATNNGAGGAFSHLAPHPPTRSLAQVAMCVCMDTRTLWGHGPQGQRLPGGVLHPGKGQVQRPSKLTGGGCLWACGEKPSSPTSWESARARGGTVSSGGHPTTAAPLTRGESGAFSPPPSVESGQERHRGGDITGAGAPSISNAPHSPQPKSALEAEGQQPPARSPPPRQSLGQHGGDRWERAGARRGRAPRGGRGGESESEGRGGESARGPSPCSQSPGGWKVVDPEGRLTAADRPLAPRLAPPAWALRRAQACAHRHACTPRSKGCRFSHSWRASGHTEGIVALCPGNDSLMVPNC